MADQMVHISLPYGSETMSFHLPVENFGELLGPQEGPTPGDLPDLLTRALDQPIGAARLEELVSSTDEVAIICDDITRPTPVKRILPQVMERLLTAGIRKQQVKIVIALGTHRPMTEEEIEAKIGAEMRSEFELIHSSVAEMEAYVPLGLSSRGMTIEVLRAVANADVKVGIGNIVPHTDAGWGGGAKIVLPGVCSARTVAENHVLAAEFGGNLLGAVTTPLREDIERVVERIGLDFIVNTVLLPSGECYAILAGHYRKAHRAGIHLARNIYVVPYSHPADIVVSSSHPYDIDFWQGSKGLWAGDRLARPGGSLILVTPCTEGLGPHGHYYTSYIGADPKGVLRALREGSVEDKTAAAGAVGIHLMKEHLDISVVTHGLPPSTVEAMGFRYYNDLQEAVEERLAFHGRGAHVSVITHGGYLCPLREGEEKG
jgi:nickel-dependent lactate racemase